MKRTEFTQKWLDALRSGEYKQGRELLVDNGAYCCLGVAGVLIDAPDMPYESDAAYIFIRKNYGISIDEQDMLVDYNDCQEKTFPEIADEIEKMLEPA